MTWAATGSAVVGGVVGGLGGGGGQQQFGPGDAIPKHLKEDWRTAGSQIMDLQTPQYYQGQLVANMNPMWSASLKGMNQFGQPGGFGGSAMNTMGTMGTDAMKFGMGGGMDYMNQLRTQGPNQFQYDQGTFNQVMGNLQPGMQGQYDAAMRDPTRQFMEQTLPGINMGSIGSGGQFGTKSFNQGAIASRGLQDRAADTASGIWQNAANQANQAAYGAGGMNLQSGNALQGQLLNNYGNFAQMGGNWLGQGYDMGVQNLGLQNKAGLQKQDYNQSLIDAQMQKHNFEQQAPWTALNNRLQMMGQQSAMPTQPGVNTGFSNVLQGAQAGMGIYDWFQNRPQNPVYGQSNPGWSTPFDQGSAWDGSF